MGKEKITIIIKAADISTRKMPPEELQVYLRERKRGAGIHRKRKGNGSYTRKGRQHTKN